MRRSGVRERGEGCHCGLRDLAEAGACRQLAGEQRGAPRVQVGVSREADVEGLEGPGGSQQQSRCITAALLCERRLRAQQVDPRPPKVVQLPRLRGRQQLPRGPECAGLNARLRSGQCALGTAYRITGERDRPLQARRGRRESASSLSAIRRLLQLDSNCLVRSRRGRREVPGATIRVGGRVRRPCQSQVYCAALCRGRRPVQRRSHQRMAERHPLTQAQQTVDLGECGIDPQLIRGPPYQDRIADRLGRCN